MADVCRICSTPTDELQCTECEKKFHFTCGTGLSNVSFRTLTKDRTFLCPICRLGANNAMVHAVITANQLFIEKKHSTAFDPGEDITGAGEAKAPTDGEPRVDEAPQQQQPGVPPQRQQQAEPPQPQQQAEPPQRQPVHTVDDSAADTRRRGPKGRPPPKPLTLPDDTMAPPNESCVEKAKQLIYRIGTLRRAPQHPTIFIGGDSHLTGMDGKDVDPSDDQVRVRSVGGLCIFAAVLALCNFKGILRRFKSVVWVLGTNDAQSEHLNNHCLDDRVKYLKLLYRESKRIFPSAEISIITPFSGIKGVSEPYLADLVKDLKYACPELRILRPPSVRNKIGRQGIHLNRAGREVFTSFLRSQLVTPKQRVFSSDSGRSGQYGPDNGGSATPVQQPPATSATHIVPPYLQQLYAREPPPHDHQVALQQYQIRDIANSVIGEFIKQQQQRPYYNHYPPLPLWR